MATTKTVTAHEIVGVRTNIDMSSVLIIEVTYDDESTETHEVLCLRSIRP